MSPWPTPSASQVVRPSARASGAPSSADLRPSPSVDIVAIVDLYRSSFTATITLLDLADAHLSVAVTFIDPDSGQADALGTYSLGPSAQISNSVPPGTYRLDFREPASSATGPTCTIEVTEGDVYSFVAVPGAIAVSRAGFTPTTVRDLFVATSSLCRT